MEKILTLSPSIVIEKGIKKEVEGTSLPFR